MRLAFLLIPALLLAAACDDGATDADAGPAPDLDAGGPTVDAGDGGGPDDAGSGTPDAGPSLDITPGIGLTEFTPLEGGEVLQYIIGRQGGQHIDIAFRARSAPEELFVEMRLERIRDGALVSREIFIPVDLAPVEGEDFTQALGRRLLLDIPSEAVGEDLRLSLKFFDEEGAELRAFVFECTVVRARCGHDDPRDNEPDCP
jgi:hypothetical protein